MRAVVCFFGGAGGSRRLRACHGRSARGWIEAWGKRRLAPSSSVIGFGLRHGGGLGLAQDLLICVPGFPAIPSYVKSSLMKHCGLLS